MLIRTAAVFHHIQSFQVGFMTHIYSFPSLFSFSDFDQFSYDISFVRSYIDLNSVDQLSILVTDEGICVICHFFPDSKHKLVLHFS